MRVSLFITCLADQFAPDVGESVVRVLRKLGCEVDFPTAQTCCGQPFFNNGFRQQARALAERMIDIFEDSAHVVSPSGSCVAMVREHFPVLFEGDSEWQPRCDAFVAKTYEFIEFITKVLKVDVEAVCRQKLTYHYTCHLRGLGLKQEAVRVIEQLKDGEYVPMEKSDQCCGFGGTFAVKFPQVSKAMVDDKADCIVATGADVVIVNDTGCAMNIGGMLSRRGISCQVRHLAQILDEGLQGK